MDLVEECRGALQHLPEIDFQGKISNSEQLLQLAKQLHQEKIKYDDQRSDLGKQLNEITTSVVEVLNQINSIGALEFDLECLKEEAQSTAKEQQSLKGLHLQELARVDAQMNQLSQERTEKEETLRKDLLAEVSSQLLSVQGKHFRTVQEFERAEIEVENKMTELAIALTEAKSCHDLSTGMDPAELEHLHEILQVDERNLRAIKNSGQDAAKEQLEKNEDNLRELEFELDQEKKELERMLSLKDTRTTRKVSFDEKLKIVPPSPYPDSPLATVAPGNGQLVKSTIPLGHGAELRDRLFRGDFAFLQRPGSKKAKK